MEALDPSVGGGPIVAAALFLGGIVAGLAVGVFVLPAARRSKRLQTELDTAQAEHAQYKEGVTQHFHKTAELVGDMTRSYKAVYDHLADGAHALCEDAGTGRSLGFTDTLRLDVVETTSQPVEAAEASSTAAVAEDNGTASRDTPAGDTVAGDTVERAAGA